MSALSQALRSMRESRSWEDNTYAKYIFNPHRSWRDDSGNPTGTRIVDKAYAAKHRLNSIYGMEIFCGTLLTNSFGRPFTKESYGTASEFNRI